MKLNRHYDNLKDLILKKGDAIKGVHKIMYKKYLLSDDIADQKEYIETVISQTNDDKKTATSIWGKDVVDYINKNLKNDNNMKLGEILKDVIKEKKAEEKPSAGLTKKQKSAVVKKAKAGKDIGKKGKGFEALAKKAGGGEKGRKIAAAAMWKNIKREGVNENINIDAPEDTDVKDFAIAVAQYLVDQYGSHLIKRFMDTLESEIKKNSDEPDPNLMKALYKNINESDDHEVSMALNSLKSIIKSTSELMNKLGDQERNIPGWIQDHIVNAENYIDQAAQGFHELGDK